MEKKKVTVEELVEKAIVDCFRVSGNGKYCIFVNIMPHVNGVWFQLHNNGWVNGVSYDSEITIYLGGVSKPTVGECKKMLKPIYDLINKNK